MAEQEKKVRRIKELEKEEVHSSQEITQKGKEIIEELDQLLDEIDEVLEKNAEEFVKSYVQRGGE